MDFIPANPDLLGVWAYITLAVVVIIEGPVATLFAAIASASGYLDPLLVFVTAAVANLTSDLLWYTIGYNGKLDWLVRYGRFFGARAEDVEKMRARIDAHVLRILFIAKLTLGFIIPVLVATGLARVPIRRWLGILCAAESIWTGTLVVAGYFFGQYANTFENGLRIYAVICFLVVVVVVIRYIVKWRSRPADTTS